MGRGTTISGTVASQPCLCSAESERPVVEFTVAGILRSRQEPGAGIYYEDISFDVVALGDLADYTTQSLTAGDQIIVSGHLEDPDMGDAQLRRKVVATDIDVNLGRLFVSLTSVVRGPTGWRPRT